MGINKNQFVGYILVAIGIVLLITIVYRNNYKDVPIIFSQKAMIASIWQRYVDEYFEPGTSRILDKQRSNVTTSEGESYALLRSVWLDDKDNFDKSWKWTKDNLQIHNSHIFSWLFGQKKDGTYGIITESNGQNSASDADSDIAVALIFAYSRWKDPKYLTEAQLIISDIWNQEVVLIKGKPYLASNNIEKKYQNILVNPSYLSPYSYRMFSVIDPTHNWMGLVDSSYNVIQKSMEMSLDKTKSVNLPPDWISIRRSDGKISAASDTKLDTNYGFDSLRLPWRIALDWIWYGDQRANSILHNFTFLADEWKANQNIKTEYGHDGTQVAVGESPAMYGGSLGALMVIDPVIAKEVYETKLVSLYNPDTDSWNNKLSYYDDNWAWFGIALYNNELPNFFLNVN